MADSGDRRPSLSDVEGDTLSEDVDAADTSGREDEDVSPPPLQPDPVERAIMILRRAESDTEKFAALLMVTKLIKAEELSEESKKNLLEAVGLSFLARLLKTSDVPEGCPPFMFRSIALTILTCFLSSCVGNPVLHELIPVLMDIVMQPDIYEDDLTLVKDSFQCLRGIASEKNGRRALINFEAIGSLVDVYIAENYFSEEAIEILLLVIGEEGSKTWEDEPESLTKLLTVISHEFSIDHSEQKFRLCEFLTVLLHSLPIDGIGTDGNEAWKKDLHKGLCDIILSKLGQELRDKALRLAGAAMESLGVAWVLHPTKETPEGGKGRQLLLMMVHLSCIEVRMSLEDKTFQEAVALASPTTACYTVLELAINFLVNGAVEFEQKQKQQLYAALKGAFNAVLQLLKEISVDETFEENKKTHFFVYATIRVLGAWLAEETAANKEEVFLTLPFIIKTCKNNFDNNKRKTTKSKKKGHAKNQKEEDKESLPDILRFLLPGLCHLTAEDRPRALLLELELETLLFEYLACCWNSIKEVFGPQSKVEEADIPLDVVMSKAESMETICNIFMNIVVQEPERVKVDPFYYTLLKFIFVKVPDIPSESPHLRLSGNLAILGLMILRHQHINVKSTDFTIFRFVQTTIRFLWDAHNVEESNDYSSLVVSSKYESHWGSLMDLWFLGMHTLSLLLPSIAWLCDFLIESEWPQTIIMTLVMVREGGIDLGLKSAFEDFLCLLAKSSKHAFTIMRDTKQLEHICHVHKFEELSKVFKLTAS